MDRISGKAVKTLRNHLQLDAKEFAKEFCTTPDVIDIWESRKDLDCEDQYAIAKVAEKYQITQDMLFQWS